jgi:hypothetical protein
MIAEHPLPAPLDTLVRATAERLRMGRTSRATVARLAAEIEHAAVWAGQSTLTDAATLLDLMACSRRLATLAGTDDQEAA